jgi:divalent metal cation (Fe/Co/Zn/Cd) transporter
MGGGMAMYEGITHVLSPRSLGDPTWAYVVLALAFIFESYTWYIALMETRAQGAGKTIWQMIRDSKDLATTTVLLEDTAALSGILIAFLGVFLGRWFNNQYIDGIASIVIGVMLAMVALILVVESRGLLLGESADPEVVKDIRNLTVDDPAVTRVNHALTMHFGPNDVLLNLEVQFAPHTSSHDIVASVVRLEEVIRDRYPHFKRIFIEAAPFRQA